MTPPADNSSERVDLRIHGDASRPTLIYLPGLHGDWTLVSGFRKAIGDRVRFIEITYPRTLAWSLSNYACEVESVLAAQGIFRGWLLGESFGSQVVWPMVASKTFQVEGVILAGGFVSHPVRWTVRIAGKVAGGVPLALLTRIIFGYAKFARFRYRHSPEALASIQEFIARRTELDRRAATHRLHLIARNDPRPIVQALDAPVFAMTGFFDPIVPWPFVRSWLRRHCPALRDYKIIWNADHNVLSTASETAAEQVVDWINRERLRQGLCTR